MKSLQISFVFTLAFIGIVMFGAAVAGWLGIFPGLLTAPAGWILGTCLVDSIAQKNAVENVRKVLDKYDEAQVK